MKMGTETGRGRLVESRQHSNEVLPKKMPDSTVFDVAKLAGVSIKTVSRVVNDEPNVRSSTRARVDQAIVKLNYQPNEWARYLAHRRTQRRRLG